MSGNEDNYTHAKGSAPTSLHASVDALAFYSDILHLIPTEPASVIIDFGGGIGRDALAFYDRAGGQIHAISIDPDPTMLAKAQTQYPDRFEIIENNYADLLADNHPKYLQDTLPHLPRLNSIAPDLKADFALCNAVLMFIKPEEREASLTAMAEHLKPGGHLVVRFRTVDLKEGMHPISEAEIDAISAKVAFAKALTVETLPPAADPSNRKAPDGQPYLWHQRVFTKQP
jgi:SAM-dependent methyltransferase